MCLYCEFREKAFEEIGIVNPDHAFIGGPDIHGNTSTTASVSVGGTAYGHIQSAYDNDYFAVTLTAGNTYQINMTGITLSDTFLEIRNSSGAYLDYDDDGGSGYNSQLTFTPTTTGTYYIDAQAYGSLTGTYSIAVAEIAINSVTAPSQPNSLLDSISWGSMWDSNTINVYFAPAGYTADGYTAETMTAFEQQQFQLAFDIYESFLDVQFNLVTNPVQADLRILVDTNQLPADALGYFNAPGYGVEGVGVFNASFNGGWSRYGGSLNRGGYDFVTILHELGHGMGLAHPHDYGGTSSLMYGVSSAFDDYGYFDLNQGIFTMMSYNSGYWTGENGTEGDIRLNWGFEGSPMALDIAALQNNYGANTSHNSGNNTYVMPPSNGAGTYWLSIWDTGGIDQIRNNSSNASRINLNAATLQYEEGGGGFISNVANVAGGFTIANGVEIENAIGGFGNDTITGTDGANTINGRGGNDTILAGNGTDLVYGGSGNDTIRGGGSDNGEHDTLNGDTGNDFIYGQLGFDLIHGGLGNDSLDGGNHADTIRGEGGNDTLFGGHGFDMLYGGDGEDVLLGGLWNDGLFGGAGHDNLDGGGGHDLMFGAAGDDFLNGADGADRVRGEDGNDTVHGRLGSDFLYGDNGSDEMYGGYGFDWLYGGDQNDLMYGGGDIDRLFGGTGNDTMYGQVGDDRLFGAAGDDLLSGGDGNDLLVGEGGNDRMSGDAGSDTFVFANGHGNDTITDFDALSGTELIDFSGLSAMGDLASVLGAATQAGADVSIDTGDGNSLLLLNVDRADLDASDFAFV